MLDSKLPYLLRWTRPFLPGTARGVIDTRLEPAHTSWTRGRTMGPRHPHSVATFDQVLRHERARSLRSNQAFCLVRFTFQAGNNATRGTDAIVNYLTNRLRAIDEMGWLDAHSIGVVLPYTAPEHGWKLVDDVCENWPDALPRPKCEVFRFPSSPFHPSDCEGHGTGNRGSDNRANGNGFSNGMNHNETSGNSHDGDQDRPTEGMEPFFVLEMPWWKRGIDIIGSMTGLILTSPLLLATALAIKMMSSGPVLFRQRRSGVGNKPFVIFKFRTMYIGAEGEKAELRKFSEQDGPAFKMANDPRVTRLGRLLRQTSIDELPQLWNVLIGEMSLVGPRPLPCGESDASENWHRRRLDVVPGITGSWQVNGRSSIPFSEWARMDLHYVGSVSLVHDLKILVMTIPAVLNRRGAS